MKNTNSFSKRALSLLLSIQASAAGKSIAELRSMFPEGKYWTHKESEGNNAYSVTNYAANRDGYYSGYVSNNYRNGIQCYGFATLLADLYSGKASCDYTDKNVYNVKTGDIIRY